MATLAELVSELKALRKGRGLLVSETAGRIAPALREISGVTEGDGPADIRDKVAQRLVHLADDLAIDLRLAVLAALAILPDARLRLYQDRTAWVATKLGRDARTVRRRVDEGIHQLAQLAQLGTPPPSVTGPDPNAPRAGWHT